MFVLRNSYNSSLSCGFPFWPKCVDPPRLCPFFISTALKLRWRPKLPDTHLFTKPHPLKPACLISSDKLKFQPSTPPQSWGIGFPLKYCAKHVIFVWKGIENIVHGRNTVLWLINFLRKWDSCRFLTRGNQFQPNETCSIKLLKRSKRRQSLYTKLFVIVFHSSGKLNYTKEEWRFPSIVIQVFAYYYI